MYLLKYLLSYFLETRLEDFHVSEEDWLAYEHKINHHVKG